jgi:hypothetical protein
VCDRNHGEDARNGDPAAVGHDSHGAHFSPPALRTIVVEKRAAFAPQQAGRIPLQYDQNEGTGRV